MCRRCRCGNEAMNMSRLCLSCAMKRVEIEVRFAVAREG